MFLTPFPPPRGAKGKPGESVITEKGATHAREGKKPHHRGTEAQSKGHPRARGQELINTQYTGAARITLIKASFAPARRISFRSDIVG